MRQIIFLGCLLCIAVSCINKTEDGRQANSDSTTPALTQTLADTLLDRAWGLYQGGKFDSALVIAEQAETSFEQGEKYRQLVKAELLLALINLRMNLFDESRNALTLAEKISRENFTSDDSIFAELHNVRGRFLYNTGKVAEAKSAFFEELSCYKIQETPNIKAKAECLKILGVISSIQGDKEAGMNFLQQALATYSALDPNLKSSYAGDLYLALGNMQFFSAKYDQALECYLHTNAIWNTPEGTNNNQWSLSSLYFNVGAIYSYKKRYDEALSFYQKSLEMCLEIVGEQNAYTAMRYSNLGNLYISMKDFDAAITAHKKAVAIRKATIENSDFYAHSLANLGAAYIGAKDYGNAEIYLLKSIKILKARKGEKNADLPLCYNWLGNLQAEKGDLAGALKSYQEALCANVPNFNSRNISDNPQANLVFSEERLLGSLRGKAATLVKMAQQSPNPIPVLNSALAAINVSVALIDQIRHGFRLESAKLFLAEESRGIYEQGIIIARALNLPELAFHYAEKSRAGVLLESIAEADARQFVGIPDSLLAHENTLRRNLAKLSNEIDNIEAVQQKSPQLDSLRIELFKNKRSYESLIAKFETDYPSYYDLKYQTTIVKAEDLREKFLDTETAILEYFLGEDSLIVFVATDDSLVIKTIGVGKSLKTQIEGFRDAIVAQNFATYTQNAVNLYRMLIQPIENEIVDKNLLIIPDDALCYLPFEALLTKSPPTSNLKDYRELPYFVENHGVSYAYSTTVLLKTAREKSVQPTYNFLGLAPSFNTNALQEITYSLNERGSEIEQVTLPAARSEITRINNLFQQKQNLFGRFFSPSSKTIMGENATESKLKQIELTEFNFIHFATHGFITEDKTGLSGLLLASESNKEDGVIYLREIYNLNLNAELVTMSACETGLGKIVRGEGPIGIARAFLYAGAKNLLVSQWRVNDASTADFMVEFYREMLSGKPKVKALRHAKLAMIKGNPRLARPFYWAPFVLIGQ